MTYKSKYKDYIRECIKKNKQIKITELSDDGIDTGKAIKEFENTFDNTFYLLYVYGRTIVTGKHTVNKRYYQMYFI